MRTEYNKLVRDKIPEIIAGEGRHAATRILDQDGYRLALRAKLVEEAEEAAAAPACDLPSELADIVEVVMALAASAVTEQRVWHL